MHAKKFQVTQTYLWRSVLKIAFHKKSVSSANHERRRSKVSKDSARTCFSGESHLQNLQWPIKKTWWRHNSTTNKVEKRGTTGKTLIGQETNTCRLKVKGIIICNIKWLHFYLKCSYAPLMTLYPPPSPLELNSELWWPVHPSKAGHFLPGSLMEGANVHSNYKLHCQEAGLSNQASFVIVQCKIEGKWERDPIWELF